LCITSGKSNPLAGRKSDELLLALLERTRTSQKTSVEDLATATRSLLGTAKDMVEGLANAGTLTLEDSTIVVSYQNRINLALEAIIKGVDLERVCRALGFREFEDIMAEAFRANGFETYTRFLLRHANKRYEIDLVGRRGFTALCVDCKHWRRGLSRGRLSQAVKKQIERTEILVKEIEKYQTKLHIPLKHKMFFIPIVLTLVDTENRMIEQVPVVSVLRLRSFLQEFDLHLDRLRLTELKPSRN